jgi:hypothetical protein
VTVSDKHSNLVWHRINNGRKGFIVQTLKDIQIIDKVQQALPFLARQFFPPFLESHKNISSYSSTLCLGSSVSQEWLGQGILKGGGGAAFHRSSFSSKRLFIEAAFHQSGFSLKRLFIECTLKGVIHWRLLSLKRRLFINEKLLQWKAASIKSCSTRGKYHCTVDHLFYWFGISCITTDKFCFYLQNRLIQTSQTGG